MLHKKYKLNPKLKIDPYESVFEGNRRISIKVQINPRSCRKAVVIGINPSTACDHHSDLTLTKICRYLYQYDIGELVMINLFETVSTEQEGIDESWEVNWERHEEILRDADVIVAAWGVEDRFLETKQRAFEYLLQFSDKVYCIQDKKGNKPRHPSRIGYQNEFVPFYGVIPEKKYPVVTLCGSTRFKEEFIKAQKQLTLEGNIVISVGLFGHGGDSEVWENMDEGTVTRTKEMLDDMHKRKIDLSDGIYVINVGGYIGESTRSEIDYAQAHGKTVRYLES